MVVVADHRLHIRASVLFRQPTRLFMSASRIIAAGILLLCSCGPSSESSSDDALACASQLLAGDLVITEVMANPEGPDEGKEFFEIYNASRNGLELTGLVLELSKSDGSSARQHTVRELTIEPGQYLALGGILNEFRSPYIAYGYGNELGAMVNSGGILSLHCGAVQLDTMTYREAISGKSQILDGNIVPDHIANNNIENFCDASTEYAPGDSGSPGAANAPCSIVAQDRCLDDGGQRDVVNPEVGDLVITEIMADPAAVPVRPLGHPVHEHVEVAHALFEPARVTARQVALHEGGHRHPGVPAELLARIRVLAMRIA